MQFGSFQAWIMPLGPLGQKVKIEDQSQPQSFRWVQTIPSAGATPAFRPIDDATPPIAWREGTLR